MSDMVTIEIHITRVITDDGDMAFTVKVPDRFSSVEILGLLEAAKAEIYRHMIGRTDG